MKTMDEHFEPVTARSLTTRIIKTLGLGNYFEDQIEAIIEPHIRKPSDDDKSVPARCEEAYNEAINLLRKHNHLVGDRVNLLDKMWVNYYDEIVSFLQNPNPFKEADIAKDSIINEAINVLSREKEAEILLRELRSHYNVCDPPNPNVIDFNSSADNVLKKIDEFLKGEKSNPQRHTFDLGLAAQGHKVVTRDGREAKVVAEGLKGVTPICAVITNGDGSKSACLFTIKGKLVDYIDNPEDLFILKEPEEVEVTLSRDKINNRLFASVKDQMHMDRQEIIKTILTTI